MLICLHASIGGVKSPRDSGGRPSEEDGRLGASKKHNRSVCDVAVDEETHLAKHLPFVKRLYGRLLHGVLVNVTLACESNRLRIEVVEIRLE